MEIPIRNVNAQTPSERSTPVPQPADGTPVLLEWCNVYEGLSDAEIAELEKTVLERADLSRPSDS